MTTATRYFFVTVFFLTMFCILPSFGHAETLTAMPTAAGATASQQVLCPDVDIMKKAPPGDISGVQADIERLNLCVERAKLLQQLDAVIISRKKELEKMTKPDNAMPTGGITTGLSAGIPALPVGSLPPLKDDAPPVPRNLKAGEVRVTGTAGSAFEKAAKAVPEWQIRKIWGQGVGMHAQIVDNGTGTILNIVKGDPLPDGAVVETISVKGVAISRNGNINDLSWEQTTEGSTSSNAKVIP